MFLRTIILFTLLLIFSGCNTQSRNVPENDDKFLKDKFEIVDINSVNCDSFLLSEIYDKPLDVPVFLCFLKKKVGHNIDINSWELPDYWIRKSQLPLLLACADDSTPCGEMVDVLLSVFYKFDYTSTIGEQALLLMRCYLNGHLFYGHDTRSDNEVIAEIKGIIENG